MLVNMHSYRGITIRTVSTFMLAFAITATLPSSSSATEDWPMWRSDPERSGASRNIVPDKLELLWQRKFTQRQQAWDDPLNLDLMSYDRTFEPIVLDGRMFVGFNDRDKLLAVSYTHLDVYKRQLQQSIFMRIDLQTLATAVWRLVGRLLQK